VTVIHRKLQ